MKDDDKECEHEYVSDFHEDEHGHYCQSCGDYVQDLDECYECVIEKLEGEWASTQAELKQAHFDRMKLADALEEVLEGHQEEECRGNPCSYKGQYDLLRWFRERMEKAQ